MSKFSDKNSNNDGSNNEDNSSSTNNNPFSFKKFITKQSETTAPIVFSNNQNSSLLSVDDDDDILLNNAKKTSKNSSNNSSNPFSFRQFLNETTSSRTNQASGDNRKTSIQLNEDENDDDDDDDDEDSDENDIILPNINNKSKIGDNNFINQHVSIIPPLSPPLSFDNNLPDFISESIGEKTSTVNNIEDPYLVLENISNALPPIIQSKSYFDLETKLPSNNNKDAKLGNELLTGSIINESQLPGYFDLEANLANATNFDFKLTNNQKMGNKHSSSSSASDAHHKQLAEKQAKIEEQQKMLEQYMKQLDALKKKEDQETKTLENIILNIEKNLTLQTNRAIEAEGLVEKLRIENKGLKVQMQSLLSENELLKMNNNNSSSMKQIINSYASQLNQAAVSGEQIIKQLIGGVDTLKLLSQSLESIGKIQEVNSNEMK